MIRQKKQFCIILFLIILKLLYTKDCVILQPLNILKYIKFYLIS